MANPPLLLVALVGVDRGRRRAAGTGGRTRGSRAGRALRLGRAGGGAAARGGAFLGLAALVLLHVALRGLVRGRVGRGADGGAGAGAVAGRAALARVLGRAGLQVAFGVGAAGLG